MLGPTPATNPPRSVTRKPLCSFGRCFCSIAHASRADGSPIPAAGGRVESSERPPCGASDAPVGTPTSSRGPLAKSVAAIAVRLALTGRRRHYPAPRSVVGVLRRSPNDGV